MGRILVTPRSVTRAGHPSVERLRRHGHEVVLSAPGRQPTENELCTLLPGCIGYVAGVEPVTARVLAAAPRLRAISRNGTGIDNIDVAAANAHGIQVLRAEGANARGVAELALGLIFSLARSIPRVDAALKRGEWVRHEGIEIEHRTLGLVGCGRIGQIVARSAGALGMKVLAHDPFAEGRFAPGAFFQFGALDAVIRGADILSLHCPPLPDGRPVLDAGALASTRQGVLVVNTARADLIDGPAMLAALESGQIGGLAVDVFPEEPPTDLALVRHPRVIATSHLGGFTRESVDRAMESAVDRLLRVLAAAS